MCENELDGNDQGEICFENLDKAHEYAKKVLSTKDEQYKLESSVLLGKILFLKNKYKEALDILQPLDLVAIKIENIGMRFARIISEGLAIVGLCKEELNYSKTNLSKNERKSIFLLYNMACHICIRHLQTLDRIKAENAVCGATLPNLIERVMQKIPAIMIQDK